MKTSLALLLLICVTQISFGVTRYADGTLGSNHYGTLAQALAATVDGDSVIVGPGSATGAHTITKDITLLGPGWEQFNLNGSIYINAPNATNVVISGIRIQPSGSATNRVQVSSTNTRVLVDRCFLDVTGYGNTYCISANPNLNMDLLLKDSVINGGSSQYVACINLGNNQAEISNCLFTCQGVMPAISGTDPPALVVSNCVFVNMSKVLSLTGTTPFVMFNNVGYDWSGSSRWGVYPTNGSWTHNASDAVLPPGEDALLLTENPFNNYDPALNFTTDSDLHLDLVNGASLMDSGIAQLQDLDGSACDRGLYGGPTPFVDGGVPAFPFLLSLSAQAVTAAGDSLHLVGSGHIGVVQ